MFNVKEYMKKYCKDNKEDKKEYNKQYNKDHKKEKKEHNKQWRKNHLKKCRQSQIKCLYGLSHEDWLKMWENQGGRCAICGDKFKKPSLAFVDHNHTTGEVRSLLCPKCNTGLGCFNDSPKMMMKVIKYLLGDK